MQNKNNSSHRTVTKNTLFKIKLYQVKNIRNVDPVDKNRKEMHIHLTETLHVNTELFGN